jgi:hypothetical protein
MMRAMASSGVAQHTAATTAPPIPTPTSMRSRMALSLLGANGYPASPVAVVSAFTSWQTLRRPGRASLGNRRLHRADTLRELPVELVVRPLRGALGD